MHGGGLGVSETLQAGKGEHGRSNDAYRVYVSYGTATFASAAGTLCIASIYEV